MLKSFRAIMALQYYLFNIRYWWRVNVDLKKTLQRYIFNIYCYWRDTVQIISPDYGSAILFV